MNNFVRKIRLTIAAIILPKDYDIIDQPAKQDMMRGERILCLSHIKKFMDKMNGAHPEVWCRSAYDYIITELNTEIQQIQQTKKK